MACQPGKPPRADEPYRSDCPHNDPYELNASVAQKGPRLFRRAVGHSLKLKQAPDTERRQQQEHRQDRSQGPGGSHYDIVRGDYTEVGCGVFISELGEVTVSQDFR